MTAIVCINRSIVLFTFSRSSKSGSWCVELNLWINAVWSGSFSFANDEKLNGLEKRRIELILTAVVIYRTI